MNNKGDPLKELLKFSITAGENAGASNKENVETADAGSVERSEEERQFLRSAIQQFMTSQKGPTDQLIDILKHLKMIVEKEQANEQAENVIDLLEAVSELCENIDVACDMHKVGGFTLIIQLLDSSLDAEIQAWAATVIGSCCQNNPYCQEKIFEVSDGAVMNMLLERTSSDSVLLRVKSLFAISCIIRQNETAFDTFFKQDGLTIVGKCLGSTSTKVQIKAGFMLRSLCGEFKKSFELIAKTPNTVSNLCKILTSCDNESNGDLIENSLSLLLSLATHDKSVVGQLVAFDVNRLMEALEQVQLKYKDADECGWPAISKNASFLLHIVKKRLA